MHGIFDPEFSSLVHSDMYRAWVHPDVFPRERQPVLQNWGEDELEEFCGVYSLEARRGLRGLVRS